MARGYLGWGGLLNAEDVETHICAKISRIRAKFIFFYWKTGKNRQKYHVWSNLTKFCKLNMYWKHLNTFLWAKFKLKNSDFAKEFVFRRSVGGYFGCYWGGRGVTYHLLVQYNVVQLCSRVQVCPEVVWFPKNKQIVEIQ